VFFLKHIGDGMGEYLNTCRKLQQNNIPVSDHKKITEFLVPKGNVKKAGDLIIDKSSGDVMDTR
jgi:sporulation protein YlmC with PRC-barrel domain